MSSLFARSGNPISAQSSAPMRGLPWTPGEYRFGQLILPRAAAGEELADVQ